MEKNEYIIDTSLDTSGVEEGAKKVNKTMQELGQQADTSFDGKKRSKKLSDAFAQMENNVRSSAQNMTNAVKGQASDALGIMKSDFSKIFEHSPDKTQEILKKYFTDVPTDQYVALENEFDTIANQMDVIRNKSKDFLNEGGDKSNKTYKGYINQLGVLERQQDAVMAKMQKLDAVGKRFKPFGTPQYVNSYEKALSKTNSTAKKSTKIFSALTSKLKSHTKQQKMTMGRMLGMSLLFSTVFKALSGITSGIKEGLTNLAKFNKGVNPVNSSLSSLKSALTQLKNSFATAFAPILTVVAPIITTFINHLSDAITTLGMFFARLTGANTYTKAKKVSQSYADTADSARDAANAQEELNNKLADYDKLAVIDKKSSSGNSGNSCNSGGNNSGVAFETVQLNDSAVKWADKFKEAWQNADFTDIGKTVGKKLKDALDNIDWGPIQTAAKKIGKSIGTFINGFVSVDGLGNKVGSTIAQSLNTVMIGLDAFLTTTNWFNVGKFIGDIVNGYVKDFNWSLVGKTVADALNAAMATIVGFLNTVNWSQLGTGIVTTISSFFATFDFSLLGQTVCSMLVAGMNLVAGIISGVNWGSIPGQIAGKLKECLTGIDWKTLLSSVGNLAGTILKAVWDWNVGLANQIGNAGKKIVDYFKSKMDTDKLSKDSTLGQKGTAILKGILKGIIDGMASIGSWIVSHIVKPFASAMAKTGLFDTVGKNLWNGLKKSVEAVLKPFGIKIKLPTWSELKASLKKTINNMISYLNSTIIKKLNDKFSINIPKNAATQWLGINGKHTLLKIPNIPALATGAVIPPNHEFLAMLGDQKSGVNIETPLATMVEAFDKALDKRGSKNVSMPEKIILCISDGRTIAELVWDEEKKRYKQTGSYKPSYT